VSHATFQVVERADGTVRWHRRAEDGAVLASSDGTYGTRHAAMREVQRITHVIPGAGVKSVDTHTP